MSDQFELFPSGLAKSQLNVLTEYAEATAGLSPEQLVAEAKQHLEDAKTAYQSNYMVNVELAAAIAGSIESAIAHWDSLSESQRSWLSGAVRYFSSSDDDEPDFDSPLGFEDDVEVLNACLKFAGMEYLQLNAEDYDDA